MAENLPNVLAVVPAKLTSVRIPRKNVEQILGTELFLYSVRAALSSKLITRVAVSSECPDVLTLASRAGATSILRPPELSAQSVPNQAVLEHALTQMQSVSGFSADILVLLQPTHPFRAPSDIDRAIVMLRQNSDATSVIALKPINSYSGHLDNWRFVPHEPFSTPRNLRQTGYINSGSFYALRVSETLSKKTFFGAHVYGLPLSRPELEIDIDEPADLIVARVLAEHYKADLLNFGLIKDLA